MYKTSIFLNNKKSGGFLFMYNFRTDLALERREILRKQSQEEIPRN